MIPIRKLLSLTAICLLFHPVFAQRTHKNHSVLATGNWYKIGVESEGVYKMDLAFLNNLGIQGSIPSAQIRLFGNGGAMLPEANTMIPPDDLEEISIMVVDGGDGVLNGSDYILFYASGPDQWIKDSANHRFTHLKNIYTGLSCYFLSIGGNGLRVPLQVAQGVAGQTVRSFDERYFHELDTVNFLSSGKEWFGEEFSAAPGRSLSRTFNLPLTDLLPQTATLVSNVAARSVNVQSQFTPFINGQPLQPIAVPAISTAQYDLFAHQQQQAGNLLLGQADAVVSYSFSQGSYNSQGWLNWFEFFCRRNLILPPGKQLPFRDWNSVGSGNADFILSQADANTRIWDITDPGHPVQMFTSLSGSQLAFTNNTDRLREYIGFGNYFPVPLIIGKLANQDLHNTTEADLIIISAPPFMAQAERLAQFHRQQGLRTIVAGTGEVFNEFSGGSPDPVAIRNFVKMYYDRYRSTWQDRPKSLLLFGRSSFDYRDRIRGNTSFVPGYETYSSLDPLASYTSDDFFGFLDDQEDINSGLVVNTLDLGIGRIPARTGEESRNFVDKLLAYHDPTSLGPWRNNLNFIADDEDQDLHLQDAEQLAATSASTAPVFNQQKVYLDAFVQENGSAGGRYPQANAVINNNIYNGTLIWNYSGHGGPQRLAEEVVIDQEIVNSWNNTNGLPLFITATCDFAPYDNPLLNSLGENLLMRPRTGAIALMTTTRVVFANSNLILNKNYLKSALRPDASGRYKTLGEAMMAGKNETYQTSGDIINNRKFTLMGDPAMTLGFPYNKVQLTRVNGIDLPAMDTLKAGDLVLLEGQINNPQGTLIGNFNGTAYLTLFDKAQTLTTLGNDPDSPPASFTDQENVLFKGKATVQNGKFAIHFRMPRDINFQYGNGRISLYAQDGAKDGNGYSNDVIIGGISASMPADQQGPEIKAYLNDEQFVNGGITNTAPVLLLRLTDSSGINTGGAGIDHDLVATLDGDNRKYFVLNNFYESDMDSYQKGSVRFQLPAMEAGPHSLRIRAWDAMNNSSEYQLDFIVVNREELRIDHVLNYPNPFTTHTNFWFEHNDPGDAMDIKVEIFTMSGKLIKTITQTINTTGNRSNDVAWDGKDEYGNKIGRGVYIYRLRVRNSMGKTAEKWERLVILGK